MKLNLKKLLKIGIVREVYENDYEKILMQMLIKSQLSENELYEKSWHMDITEQYCILTSLNHNFDKLPIYLNKKQNEKIFIEYFLYFPYRENEKPYFGHFNILINSPLNSPIMNLYYAHNILKYKNHNITYYSKEKIDESNLSIRITNTPKGIFLNNTCFANFEYGIKVRVEFDIIKKYLRIKKDWNKDWDFTVPWNHTN